MAFRNAVKGTKKLQQDTINLLRYQKATQFKAKISKSSTRDYSYYFSDEFEPMLKKDEPTQYARTGVPKYEVNRLKNGVYVPDIFLDLHGMTQVEAKRELSAFIAECIKENIHCACIMHGIGKHILKHKTPLWLAQHPDVLAFYQAALQFGGHGALLVLIETPEI
ncbi:hypothetical protein BTN50_0494 [Candidatus Enterovibrio altilux]|uniref:Ribosome rescue factor SmrB n=1 Tax=Candidatus Enterovibrio altilux TaxID=1927128 RepID=A0A291B7Q3_9GAMM|nr:hypothetical protein BTN50_0494 [Candidatus Enterovibrio luxaltus]